MVTSDSQCHYMSSMDWIGLKAPPKTTMALMDWLSRAVVLVGVGVGVGVKVGVGGSPLLMVDKFFPEVRAFQLHKGHHVQGDDQS